MVREDNICDKCGKERNCDVEEFACISEGFEMSAEGKKAKKISVYEYLTSVTCRLCDECGKKRRMRFFLFALLFLAGSLPFFIWWMYIEFGFVLIIGSFSVALLSGKGHEMEYIARHNYRIFREGNDELIIHPKIITNAAWEEIKKDPAKFNSKIII